MSKKSKKQRAKERKAEQVRRQSGVTLRAVTPPPSAGAKVLELKRAKPAEAKPPEPVVTEQQPATVSAPPAATPEEDDARREAIPPGGLGADETPQKVGGAEADAVAPAQVAPPAADAEALAKVETPEADAAPADPAARAPAEPPEEHRASPRVSVAVDIHLSSESHFFSGLSGDISEGGLFFSTYRPLSVGTQVDVEFSLPGTDRPVHARGEVRWIREHSADQSRGVGIAFEDLSDEDRDAIHAFCSSRPPLYYEDVG